MVPRNVQELGTVQAGICSSGSPNHHFTKAWTSLGTRANPNLGESCALSQACAWEAEMASSLALPTACGCSIKQRKKASILQWLRIVSGPVRRGVSGVIYPGPRGIIGASRSEIVLYYGKTVAPNALLPRASLRLSPALDSLC